MICHRQASGCPCSKADCVPTAIKETKETLLNVNKTLGELKKSTARLSTSLHDVKTNLEQSLNDPTCSTQSEMATCNDVRMTLSQLDDNTNLGQVRRVTEPQGCVFGTTGQGSVWVRLSGAQWPGSPSDFSVSQLPRCGCSRGREEHGTPSRELSRTDSMKQQREFNLKKKGNSSFL